MKPFHQNRELPPRYPGTWNVWTTMSPEKIARPYSGRASEQQLLLNEIGDYSHRVTPELRRRIDAAVAERTWFEIPTIVHQLVCPECSGAFDVEGDE